MCVCVCVVWATGYPPLLMSYCREYWDGSNISPLTDSDRKELMTIFERWDLEDFDVVAFGYSPVPVTVKQIFQPLVAVHNGRSGDEINSVTMSPKVNNNTSMLSRKQHSVRSTSSNFSDKTHNSMIISSLLPSSAMKTLIFVDPCSELELKSSDSRATRNRAPTRSDDGEVMVPRDHMSEMKLHSGRGNGGSINPLSIEVTSSSTDTAPVVMSKEDSPLLLPSGLLMVDTEVESPLQTASSLPLLPSQPLALSRAQPLPLPLVQVQPPPLLIPSEESSRTTKSTTLPDDIASHTPASLCTSLPVVSDGNSSTLSPRTNTHSTSTSNDNNSPSASSANNASATHNLTRTRATGFPKPRSLGNLVTARLNDPSAASTPLSSVGTDDSLRDRDRDSYTLDPLDTADTASVDSSGNPIRHSNGSFSVGLLIDEDLKSVDDDSSSSHKSVFKSAGGLKKKSLSFTNFTTLSESNKGDDFSDDGSPLDGSIDLVNSPMNSLRSRSLSKSKSITEDMLYDDETALTRSKNDTSISTSSGTAGSVIATSSSTTTTSNSGGDSGSGRDRDNDNQNKIISTSNKNISDHGNSGSGSGGGGGGGDGVGAIPQSSGRGSSTCSRSGDMSSAGKWTSTSTATVTATSSSSLLASSSSSSSSGLKKTTSNPYPYANTAAAAAFDLRGKSPKAQESALNRNLSEGIPHCTTQYYTILQYTTTQQAHHTHSVFLIVCNAEVASVLFHCLHTCTVHVCSLFESVPKHLLIARRPVVNNIVFLHVDNMI